MVDCGLLNAVNVKFYTKMVQNGGHFLMSPSRPLTFAFQEVERAKEASVSTRRGLGALVTEELCELRPGKIDQPSDVAEHQLQEDVRALVTEFLHKKVRVENDGRPTSSRAAG